MLEKLEKFQLGILGLLIAVSIIIGVNTIAGVLPNDGITVTGSASRVVQSDSGSLSFNITARQKTRKLSYDKIRVQIPMVINYIKSQGFDEKNIDIKTTNGYCTYKTLPNGNSSNEVEHYNLFQPITVKSNDVEKIKKLSLNIAGLMDKGIEIEVSSPDYYYSKIADLKVELLKEATTDAKQRASAMLKATRNRTGKIQSVKMGVFQITAPESTNVSDSGIYDTESIEKKVTAVANVVFKIK